MVNSTFYSAGFRLFEFLRVAMSHFCITQPQENSLCLWFMVEKLQHEQKLIRYLHTPPNPHPSKALRFAHFNVPVLST